jgi:hypothetical protein
VAAESRTEAVPIVAVHIAAGSPTAEVPIVAVPTEEPLIVAVPTEEALASPTEEALIVAADVVADLCGCVPFLCFATGAAD